MQRTFPAILAAIIVAAILLGPNPGCKKDTGPTETPPDTVAIIDPYGSGNVEFDADSAGGHFAADGKYKPSSEFGNDSSSQGAGGFAADTTLFSNRVSAVLTAYTHALAGSVLNERLIILSVHDTTGTIRPGVYPFSHMNTASAKQAAYAYFVFSDSLHFFNVFIPKSGNLFVTSFDASTNKVAGSFSGTFMVQGDTLTITHLTNGHYSLQLARTYFDT